MKIDDRIKKDRNELEQKVKTLLKKFERTALLQFCFDLIGKEPKWREVGSGVMQGEVCFKYEPPNREEFGDFIWTHVIQNKISYNDLQDFAVKYNLVPRNYFSEREDLISNNETFAFLESAKSIILKRQNEKCERCGRFSPPLLFDHKDENQLNNSLDNCQALCVNCYKRKKGISD